MMFPRKVQDLRSLMLFASLTLLEVCVPTAVGQNSLASLRSGHPRLLMADSDIPAIRENIKSDPFAAATFAELTSKGDKMLAKPVSIYEKNNSEHSLLPTARSVEGVVLTLSMLYRLTGQRSYADRAIQEMLAACAFPDWNPSHFLDTAELTAALGIGYDWLYPVLSAQQRSAIHYALVTRGLDPWLVITGAEPNPKGLQQFNMLNNWMQVCVGGETVGALALADEEPARARYIVSHSQDQIKSVMKFFAPDGGFDEGPVYWSYATSYNVLYLAALTSALGTDFGISGMPGFADTGNYRVQAFGPSYELANFGDAHTLRHEDPQMFWMAERFDKPEYALAERRMDEAFRKDHEHEVSDDLRFLALTLVYYKPKSAPAPHAAAADPPTVASFQRSGLAFLRSAWSLPDGERDLNAFYIAFKGGLAMSNHGHLDMGSFVLDALGERWALDPGPDSYGLPLYNSIRNPERWSYFRTSTAAHNTLTIHSKNESLASDARLTAVGQGQRARYAVMNLDSAYPDELKHWQRGVEILPGPRVVIQDEISPRGTADVVWRMLTAAKVEVGADPTDVVLRRHGKTLYLHLASPADARFQRLVTPSPPSPQTKLEHTEEVLVHLPSTDQPTTISIVVSSDAVDAQAGAVVALSQWTSDTR